MSNTPEQDMQDRAMSYSLDDDESADERFDRMVQADKDRRFEDLLREAERQGTERIRKACLKGLLDLGILPRSLVRERL